MKKINFIRSIISVLLCFFITTQPYAFAFNYNIPSEISDIKPWAWIVYGVIIGSFIWLFIVKHSKKSK